MQDATVFDSSSGGPVSITGTGSPNGTDMSSGIVIESTSSVEAFGGGITLTGTGGGNGNNNYGIQLIGSSVSEMRPDPSA